MTILKVGMTIKNFIAGINANFSEVGNVSYKVLFDGTANIPSKSSGNSATITLTDDITKFDGVIIQRETSSAWQTIQSISVGTVFKVMNAESDFEFVEGCNLYMCNAEVLTSKSLKLNNNVYAGVKTSATARYMESFGDKPINKIIGIKFN